jgi:hypothetical protein
MGGCRRVTYFQVLFYTSPGVAEEILKPQMILHELYSCRQNELLARERERKSIMGLRKIIETSLKIAWTISSILTNASRFSSVILVHVKIASFREGHDRSFNS